MEKTTQLQRRIQCAKHQLTADCVIKNTSIFHLENGEIEDSVDIALIDGYIAAVGHGYEGREFIDGAGLTAVPGFIDAHVHIESTMLSPAEYEKCVLPHGITTAVCDPHELANVVGEQAFDYLYQCQSSLAMSLVPHLSSCVPASPFETSGADITADILQRWHDRHPEAGLAELMNFPGLLNGDPEVLKRVAEFALVDGHCPLLSGDDLNAYISAGVSNCHECSNLAEGEEKIRRGMAVLIREGGVARNLEALLPLITERNYPMVAFCTDDRNPLDIATGGHLDAMVRRAIAGGATPLSAYRAASAAAAIQMRLHDRGFISPGKRADILLIKELSTCDISKVIAGGRLVTREMFASLPPAPSTETMRHSLKCRRVTPEDFRYTTQKKEIPVIGIEPFSLLTQALSAVLPTGESPHERIADIANDYLKVAVIERHGKNGHIGRGFVHGFGLKRGAIASSVSHDAHNISVIGTTDDAMALAVNALIDQEGGFVVVDDKSVLARVPLPIAGLLSDAPSEVVISQLKAAMAAAKAIGCPLEAPFLQQAFVPLSVIPFLKITDKGVIDTLNFRIIEQ